MDPAIPSGVREAVLAVRACLAAESGRPAAWPAIPPAMQASVVDVVTEQRVTWLVAKHSDELGLTGTAADRLRAVAAHDVRAAMRVQVAAAMIVGGLNERGVRCLTYKGAALALTSTGDAAARGPGDVDLLVAPDDVPATHSFLQDQGAHFVDGYSPSPESDLWPAARRIGCEVPYRWKDVDIDVHWRLDRLPQIADLPFEDLWRRREVVTIGGRSLPTLGSDDALLVTCAHGTKEQWRHWRWIVDLVRQARQVSDWSVLVERSRQTGCEEALAVGLAMHELLAPLTGAPTPGHRPRRLAYSAWENACRGSAPFGDIALRKQLDRIRWTWQTLPSAAAIGSLLLRQAVTPLDMAEVPLPAALVAGYPVVRPYLWARRLASGSYGPTT